MLGTNVKVKCPSCGGEFYAGLGVTQYVRVNGSERQYVECGCPACGKQLWFAHSVDTLVDVIERKENDKIEPAGVICW